MGAAAGLYFMIASAAVSGVSAYQQGKAAKMQARTERDILNFNAKQKLKEAEDATRYAQEEAARFVEEGKRRISTGRVSYARGGILAEGTPAFVLEEMAEDLESDKMEILRQGFLTSSRAAVEATSLRLQGKAARQRGEYAYRGSLLSGAGKIASTGAQAYYYGSSLNA